MTSSDAGLLEPPYSPDLLADLHAGVLPDAVSAQLWPRVRQDPDAARILDALDAVTERLATAGRELASGEPMPPEVAERIDRALSAAPPVQAPTDSSTQNRAPVPLASRRRMSRTVLAAGIAASVVLVTVVAAAVVVATSDKSGVTDGGYADDLRADAPTLVLSSDDLDSSLAFDVMATRGRNEVTDAGNLRECLIANGFRSNSTVLGSAPVELDGKPGVMLVIATASAADGMVLLAVGPDCGANNPATLVRRDIE
ncbi:MAG: hypothetical protein ABW364_09905 [Rhodococcus fascians]|nr:hypothetical protein [Rhodococcus sp. 06-418-1B]OZC75639.1 hypothetical protein CH282_27230 [Rhodococcus sp. 06-418-1B]